MNLESAIIYLHQGSGAQKQVLSYLSQNYLLITTSPEPMWSVQHVYDEHNM